MAVCTVSDLAVDRIIPGYLQFSTDIMLTLLSVSIYEDYYSFAW